MLGLIRILLKALRLFLILTTLTRNLWIIAIKENPKFKKKKKRKSLIRVVRLKNSLKVLIFQVTILVNLSREQVSKGWVLRQSVLGRLLRQD